jgi:hypothetical protein
LKHLGAIKRLGYEAPQLDNLRYMSRREFHSFRASQRDMIEVSDRNREMVAEKFRRLAPPQIVS